MQKDFLNNKYPTLMHLINHKGAFICINYKICKLGNFSFVSIYSNTLVKIYCS